MLGRSRGLVGVVMVVGFSGCWSGSSSSPSSPSVASSLIGPTWTLARLDGQPVIAAAAITAEFAHEGRVAGSSGCNRYTGSAQVSAGRLSVGPLASTMMACEHDGLMVQETRYLTRLQAATHYAISGDELRLGTSATDAPLVFTSR